MNPKQERYCCEILQHYGLQNQLWQTVEEMAELTQAIVKHHRYGTDSAILEELADVKIMLKQIEIALTEEQKAKVNEHIDIKLQRQISRVRSGE